MPGSSPVMTTEGGDAKTGHCSQTNSQPSFRGARILCAAPRRLGCVRASPESITPVVAMAYTVYLLASGKHGTLYVGMTNDLVRRGYERRSR